MSDVLAIAVIVIVASYLWAPFMIYLTNRSNARPTVVRLKEMAGSAIAVTAPGFPEPAGDNPYASPSEFQESRAEQLFGQVADYLSEASQTLEHEGFVTVDTLYLPDAVPNVESVLLLVVNRRTDEYAWVTAYFATVNGITRLKATQVEFITRYRDGRIIGTSNTQVIGCLARIRGHDTLQLPQIRDLRQLHRLHSERCRREAPNAEHFNRLDSEFDGDSVGFLCAVRVEDLARQVPAGYLRLTANGETYRPTLKGAFLMTWKLLWPVKQLRIQLRNRRAARLAAELMVQR